MSTECQTENVVVELIRSRGVVGRKKYDQSMDRKDLRPEQWARHLQEELADALQYAERLRGACELLSEARDIMTALAADRGWEVAREWVKKFDSQFVQVPPEEADLPEGFDNEAVRRLGRRALEQMRADKLRACPE